MVTPEQNGYPVEQDTLQNEMTPEYAEGQFAVETDEDWDELLVDDGRTTAEQAEMAKNDRIAELYVNGHVIPEGEDWDGITSEDMTAWYSSLDPSVREEMEAYRTHGASQEDVAVRVRAALEENAPELLHGRLPADLEQLVGAEYQLGINQSGPDSLDEAQALLVKGSGIDMGMYGSNLDQRFLVVDSTIPDAATDAATYGYYGHREGSPDSGKFVAVMPGSDYHEELPDDFFVSNGNQDGDIYRGSQSVNAKYIAGFIDDQGAFHRNTNFMKSNIPQLAAVEQADWA